MALIYFYDATELDKAQLSDGLSQTDHCWKYVEDAISIENIDPETEVISVFVSSTVTKEIIDSLPKLRLVACRSTGFNNVDLKVTESRGITVVNVPTYGDRTVAEFAFTLLLALSRKLLPTLESFNDEVDSTQLTGFDLYGKTLGVIGTGHIGQASAQIAHGFGMQLLGYDPYPNEAVQEKYNLRYVGLDELLKESDVITLHVPYSKANHHLINADALAKMKPTAILVNTARGELVDTKALVEYLSLGKIAGAALDVFEGEHLMSLGEEMAILRRNQMTPEITAHSVEVLALHKMHNVLLAPHNAFNTVEAIRRINDTTTQNIIRFWYGEIPNKVNAPKATMGKLFLSRHTESEWNATGQWTGTQDVHLSQKGFHEAALLGILLRENGAVIDQAYCSQQVRTMETLEGILNASQQFNVPKEPVAAINERDYGEYTGKNKWEMRELVGEEEFNKIRRGWNHPVPGGETLKTVYERVIPFYKEVILPQLKEGKNILLVAHGNSIRALMKYIDSISDEDVETLEMIFGTIVSYEVNDEGLSNSKEVYSIDSPPPNA